MIENPEAVPTSPQNPPSAESIETPPATKEELDPEAEARAATTYDDGSCNNGHGKCGYGVAF